MCFCITRRVSFGQKPSATLWWAGSESSEEKGEFILDFCTSSHCSGLIGPIRHFTSWPARHHELSANLMPTHSCKSDRILSDPGSLCLISQFCDFSTDLFMTSSHYFRFSLPLFSSFICFSYVLLSVVCLYCIELNRSCLMGIDVSVSGCSSALNSNSNHLRSLLFS